MKEGITSRVGRIIAGGAHKIVDMLENSAPKTVLEEAIREIDSAIYEVRSELGKTAAKKHLTTSRLKDENSTHQELSSKIELAIQEKREDLAEAAIARQLDIEAQVPILENTIRECTESEKRFEGFITALQAKKRQMQEELKAYCESQSEAQAVRHSGKNSATGINKVDARVACAESVFDRLIEKSTSSCCDMENESQLAELEDLSRKNQIKERLETIKARLKAS